MFPHLKPSRGKIVNRKTGYQVFVLAKSLDPFLWGGKKKQLKRTKHVCVKQFSLTCDLLSLKIHLQSLREMASLKLPEVVPSPTQDSERLRKAFQGFSLSLSLQIQGTCINAEESYKTDIFFLWFKWLLNLGR